MNTAALTAQKLGLSAGSKILCADLDFTLRPGEIVALLGRNGSGKTTLLLALAGLRQPASGAIRLGEENLSETDARRRAKHIALMLSPRQVAESLRGRELVELGRWPHTPWHGGLSNADCTKVREAMEITGTTAFAESPLGRLSDGERQKLGIARALAQEAGILLLDEPLSHLDAPSRLEILRLLRRLAESEGKAVLFSCHDLDLAFRHAHRVLALLPGGEWRAGTPGEVAEDPICAETLGMERK